MTGVGKKGLITFCFNAHLPFARFSKAGSIFQERWFFEAMLESYLPMYQSFYKLTQNKIPFSLLISISPTLMTLLQDEDLQTRFVFYMQKKLNLAMKERERHNHVEQEEILADYYVTQIESMIKLYRCLGGDLLSAVKKAQEQGYCEVITSVATNAFLPLYASYPAAVKAQVATAIKQYHMIFKRKPAGIFLPFGGYYPGLDFLLKELGIRYFITAGQAVLQGEPKPSMGVFMPVVSESGVVAFPRYSAMDEAIWGEDGFAKNPFYRNFYHEDLQSEVVLDYSNRSMPSKEEPIIYLEGFKYCSNDNEGSGAYCLTKAMNQAKQDAHDFIENCCAELETASVSHSKTAEMLLVADLELFGHRWFEGIFFIEELFRHHATIEECKWIVPFQFLKYNMPLESISLSFASWGSDGYAQVWLSQQNDWLIRYLFKTIEQMNDLVDRFSDVNGLKKRVLDQATREVLLLMAGDWPLLLSQHLNEEIALQQIKRHLSNFKEIYEAMSCNVVRALWLTEMEQKDDIFKFPNFSYELFR